MRRRVSAVAVVIVLCSVPRHLLAQRDWSSIFADQPVDVACALIDAGVPVGLEVRKGEERPTHLPETLPEAPVPSVDSVVAEFNRRHREYEATVDGGAVLIRPRQEKAAALDQKRSFGAYSNTGVIPAMKAVFAVVDPSLQGSGTMGSAIGGRPDQDGSLALITLAANSGSVTQRLFEIFKQIKFVGWLVVSGHVRDSIQPLSFSAVSRGCSFTTMQLSVPDGV